MEKHRTSFGLVQSPAVALAPCWWKQGKSETAEVLSRAQRYLFGWVVSLQILAALPAMSKVNVQQEVQIGFADAFR